MRDTLTHRLPDVARLATFGLPLRGIGSFQTASKLDFIHLRSVAERVRQTV